MASRRKLTLNVEGRIRKVGAGRQKVEEGDEQLQRELAHILEETTAGDPMSALRWTNKYAIDRRRVDPTGTSGE